MPVLRSVGEMPERMARAVCPRTKGQIEAEISRAIIRFDREHWGRGPGDVRTRIVQDMVIVRSIDVLTPSERALIRAGSVDLVKQVRSKLYESHQPEIYRVLRELTGCEVVSMHKDLSTRTGERFIVFILSENLEQRM
jgi:uncharacterized protein YbcI